MLKVKHCPFCGPQPSGKQPMLVNRKLATEWRVECQNCHASTEPRAKDWHAVVKWNKRSREHEAATADQQAIQDAALKLADDVEYMAGMFEYLGNRFAKTCHEMTDARELRAALATQNPCDTPSCSDMNDTPSAGERLQ